MQRINISSAIETRILWLVGFTQLKKKYLNNNKLIIRMPKDIADDLKLKPDEKVKVYAEGKKKLIVDL